MIEHKWQFVRLGGFDQVNIRTGKDITSLKYLDQKLWAVLSCPVNNIEIDQKTLFLIDTDNDGYIRIPEILSAIEWCCSLLKNPDILINNNKVLKLMDINTDSENGKRVFLAAKKVLENTGKSNVEAISLDDISDTINIFKNTKFNGDGIITVQSTDNENLKKVIEEIIICVGSVEDLSGLPGICSDKVNLFFSECDDFNNWYKEYENNSEILLFKENIDDVYQLYKKIKTKIDDYFTRCKLRKYDENATNLLNSFENIYKQISLKDIDANDENIGILPLSLIHNEESLNLKENINPFWASTLHTFNKKIVLPLFGEKEKITFDEWQFLKDKFSNYENWLNGKKGILVEKLGINRIREILSGNYKNLLLDLIEKDKELEPETKAISELDKLIRYYCFLNTLLNNYVSFSNFYNKKQKAIFQVGTLYIDSRACELCIKVDDISKHSQFAARSHLYIIYCECSRNNGAEKINIAAAITAGDSDQLFVGRNGVFYDCQGRDWNATVVKIIETSISLRQAFWAPYKRVSKMISEQIQKFAAAKAKQREEAMAAKIMETKDKVQENETNSAQKNQPLDIAKFAGIFAAIGLAVGALGTAIVSIAKGLFSLQWWQIPLVLIGAMLAVSLPSMILTWFKLRNRNIAPLLDANGWAVNAKLKINILFGATLTYCAKLPASAEHIIIDPFNSKKSKWRILVYLFFILAILFLIWQYNAKEKLFFFSKLTNYLNNCFAVKK